ncbi:hypothetical protein [Quadrisphaera granulorum]|uniref:hypothetical protein n=1 Tax=Quadrisphaera granulorum TaxID=317664 RepID=UPI0011B565AB|nr:hypothetical protein [Quadrisphaera granulorum]
MSFTQAARKHKVGKAHALHVLHTCPGWPIRSKRGEEALLFVGPDDRGLELELLVVFVPDGLLVLHVMPTALRRKGP